MKKRTALLVLVLALMAALAACSAQPGASRQPEPGQTGGSTGGQPAAEQAATAPVTKPPAAENPDITWIKEHLRQGLSQEEVRQLLGDAFTRVKSAKDNREMWRYDIGAQEGYQSPDDQYDTVDVEGIRNGEVEMIVFVGWTIDGRVDAISAYYLKESDGNVYDFRVLPNGEVQEQAI
ncbi:hypothetical protein [Brevibacillus marinus]|uniref:hypothetical protein n=1 Tax=Brevibacillus marinus TaxID=2496837 RepID=UPI000F81B08E|nr:hypothetical protein [Brevibacillus marinus]